MSILRHRWGTMILSSAAEFSFMWISAEKWSNSTFVEALLLGTVVACKWETFGVSKN